MSIWGRIVWATVFLVLLAQAFGLGVSCGRRRSLVDADKANIVSETAVAQSHESLDLYATAVANRGEWREAALAYATVIAHLKRGKP